MFKKLGIVAALASTLTLGACNENGSVTIPEVGTVSIADVQIAVVKACGFVPTAQTVISLVSTFQGGVSPILDTASAVVGAVCTAVTANKTVNLNPQLRRSVTPAPTEVEFGTVNGIVIQGHFVN